MEHSDNTKVAGLRTALHMISLKLDTLKKRTPKLIVDRIDEIALKEIYNDILSVYRSTPRPQVAEYVKSFGLPDGWNVKREDLILPINGKDESWHYLTIYDKDNNVITRSQPHHMEGTIRLEYNGLIFYSERLAVQYGEEQIFIQIKSIKEYLQRTAEPK